MGNYRRNGKTEQRSSVGGGKRDSAATVTEDQHGMTSTTPATETREVSQPSRTPGKNSVLSEPMHTLEREQLDGPLRSKSNSTK